MQSRHASKAFLGKYIFIEGVLYFISESDINPRLRLFVPEHLREHVLETYHTIYMDTLASISRGKRQKLSITGQICTNNFIPT